MNIPIGTVLVLTEPRPPTHVPEHTDPDTGRTKAAHTLPYPWNVVIVSGAFDLGEAGIEAVLTPLSSHGETLLIAPSMILRAGFEIDEVATRKHAQAVASAAAPKVPGGPAAPWMTDPAEVAETTT